MSARARAVARRLSDRDHAVLTALHKFRLMTGSQLRRLLFPGDHLPTQARKARAALQRLASLQVVVRLQRRVGGIRAGSEGYTYGLSGLGYAVLDLVHGDYEPGRHRRVIETKPAHQGHVLAISELAVSLGERATADLCVIEELCAEPACWRWFSGLGGGSRVLKPDAFVRLTVGDYETSAFIEQDMATESSRVIGQKLSVYVDYWRSGLEQQRHGLFPRVWWLVPHDRRLHALRDTVRALPQDVHNLFHVVLSHEAPDQLIQPTIPEGGAL